MYSMIATDKLDEANKLGGVQALLRASNNVFTIDDLMVLWGIGNKNTLWKTISRYVRSGTLIRIYRGLYSKIPLDRLRQEELGCALMGPFSYISLETVLAQKGVILQNLEVVSLVGKTTKNCEVAGTRYVCKQMQESFLLNRAGIEDLINYSVASLERAIADLDYYKPNYYLDNPSIVNPLIVSDIKEEVGYL